MPKDEIFDQIDRPYDNNLQREQDETNVSNGNVEERPVKSSGGMGDVWIKNFIRSDNWKPKSVGFYIDGQTGYAEFTNVFVSGEIDNGLLNIVGNDIYLYDDSTGGGGSISGNTASIIFIRTDDESQYFTIQKRAGVDFDKDNVLEVFSSTPVSGRHNFIFIGRDGLTNTTTNKNVGAVVINANIISTEAAGNGNGMFQVSVSTDGAVPTLPHINVFDSRNFGSTFTGVSSLINGSGTKSFVGLSYNGFAYLYYATAMSGIFPLAGSYSGTHFYPDVTASYDLGDSATPLRWRTIYLVNTPNVSSDVRTKKNIVDISYGLDTVEKIRPVVFERNGSDKKHLGFIAQELMDIVPEIVDGSDSGGYGVSYEEIIPILVSAIKELRKEVSSIKELTIKNNQI